MTPGVVERAIAEIRKRGTARTPVLAEALGIRPEEIDQALSSPCELGLLISCGVMVGEQRMREYRAIDVAQSVNPSNGFLFQPLKPKTSAAPVAADARQLSPSAKESIAPVPAVAPREEPMKPNDNAPNVERVLATLRKHVALTVDQWAKRADIGLAGLYKILPALKRQHGVVKVDGLYQIGGASKSSRPSKPKATRARKRAAHNGSDIISILRAKQDALRAEIEQLDRTIKVVEEALAA